MYAFISNQQDINVQC